LTDYNIVNDIDLKLATNHRTFFLRIVMGTPTPDPTPDSVYLCQISPNVSCGACCGPHNVADPFSLRKRWGAKDFHQERPAIFQYRNKPNILKMVVKLQSPVMYRHTSSNIFWDAL